MQRVQSFSLPNQIENDDKVRCLHYQRNFGCCSAAAFVCVCVCVRVPQADCPDVPCIHDAQLLWYLQQWQQGDSVLAEDPACVATRQLLLGDITADNLL